MQQSATRFEIMDAQIEELRAIKADMDRTGDPLVVVMKRRPPWIGWIDKNGQVRESPRYLGEGKKGSV